MSIALVLAGCGSPAAPGRTLSPTEACADNASGDLVTFADPILHQLVQLHLGFEAQPQQALTCQQLAGLTSLQDASVGGGPKLGPIRSLSGLQNLVGLSHLQLVEHEYSDLSPLRSLRSLTTVDVSLNSISVVEPLADLAGIEFLNLGGNLISDATPLAGLIGLEYLDLFDNAMLALPDLSALVELWSLNLNDNGLSDLGPLSAVGSLEVLRLANNSVATTGALSGLSQLRTLELTNNAITDLSGLPRHTAWTNLLLSYNSGLSDATPLTDGSVGGSVLALVGTSVSCADVLAIESFWVSVGSDCP